MLLGTLVSSEVVVSLCEKATVKLESCNQLTRLSLDWRVIGHILRANPIGIETACLFEVLFQSSQTYLMGIPSGGSTLYIGASSFSVTRRQTMKILVLIIL